MKPSFSTYWRNIANGTSHSLPERLLHVMLMPFSAVYASIQKVRAGLYNIGVLRSYRLPCPVISIGNLTVGGTGKTPVTAYIARMLIARGLRVVVLSRGYGGSLEGTCVVVSDGASIMVQPEQCGDEPFLLASIIPGLMVVIGSDRHAAGLMAMEQLAPDVFLLDDGYQHLRLQRDLNILLVDCLHPFGNGWTLPAGLLREPTSAGRRANLVIQTRCPATGKPAAVLPGRPVCTARHSLANVTPLLGGAALPLSSLNRRNALAFAGIADPQNFFDELRLQGVNVVATICLPDHVAYDSDQITTIAEKLHESGADCAITTEKDGVKLKHLPAALAAKILLARLELTIDDPTPLNDLLRNFLQK